MLPVIAARACSAVGCGVALSSAFALISWPDVQKPHCGASCSTNACCSGSSVPFEQPFDRLDRPAVGPHRELAARVDRLAVEQHRAGAALAAVAADLRAGQPGVIAQHLGQRPAILDLERAPRAVDGERDRRARARRARRARAGARSAGATAATVSAVPVPSRNCRRETLRVGMRPPSEPGCADYTDGGPQTLEDQTPYRRDKHGSRVSRRTAADCRRLERPRGRARAADLRMRRAAAPARDAGGRRAALVGGRGAGDRPALRARAACRSSRAATAPACRAARCRSPAASSSRSRGSTACSTSTSRTSASPSSPASPTSTSRKQVAPFGYYYAPDPSSQQVCSIGGNVAENSGGAHCLKYGFTVHHVLGVEAVLPDGELVHLGGTLADTPGPDLLGLLVGSEGTLAVVTSVTVRILRRPETVQTLLAAFDTIDAGGAVVSDIIGAGIIPAAVEMMDSLAIRAAEAAVHPNFPDADTVLIVELDGPAAEVRALFDSVEAMCRRARRDDDRGRADRRAARADLARAQGGVRGDGPRVAELLRAGRRRAAHEAAGGAEPHPRARSAIGPADRQRLPRRRRQPAPADLLRRADPGPVGRAPSRSPPRSCRTASRPAARSPASTASAPTSRSTCRRCSRRTIWR